MSTCNFQKNFSFSWFSMPQIWLTVQVINLKFTYILDTNEIKSNLNNFKILLPRVRYGVHNLIHIFLICSQVRARRHLKLAKVADLLFTISSSMCLTVTSALHRKSWHFDYFQFFSYLDVFFVFIVYFEQFLINNIYNERIVHSDYMK